MREEIIALLRCPLCHGPLAREGSALVCAHRHCFDVARQGHVNFVPEKRDTFYTKNLFESRAAVFAAGVFAPVIQAISDALERQGVRDGVVLVDAGCGEGYYTKSVCPERRLTRIGFDLAKEAIRLAARGPHEAAFFVGDLANIPLTDRCADVLLDVFTPANYDEFARVLKPDGILVKLWPRAGYLRELRSAARGKLRHDSYDDSRVADYLRAHATALEHSAITYSVPVDAPLAAHLARMTPMLAGIDVDMLDLTDVREITIDMNLFVGRIGARMEEERT